MQQLESWPTDSLIEYARNPRKNDHAVDRVAAAIREFGFRVPILAKSDKTIVDGHLRLKAANKLGLEEVPVLLCDDMTDIQVRAFRLSVNKVSEFADWDDEMLRVELDELGKDGFDIELTGFSLDEIADLQIEEVPEGLTDEDAVPEVDISKVVSVRGDVWVLGHNRVMCGDSTMADDIEKLTLGEKAQLLHADPPYGMGKEGDGVANDNLYNENLDKFQMDWWTSFRMSMVDNASAYIWGNSPDLWRWWYGSLGTSERLTLRNQIVWDKKHGQGMSSDQHRMFPTSTEHCLFFMVGEQGFNNNADNYWDGWEPLLNYLKEQKDIAGLKVSDIIEITGKSSASHYFTTSQWALPTKEHYEAISSHCGDKAFNRSYDELKKEHDELKKEFYSTRAYFDNVHDNMRDVWDFPRVTRQERHDHATPKPVIMMERVMKSSLPPKGLCLEPFGGSGSTLMGAEKSGRRCFTMELQPFYVDVIINRWQQYTGKVAVLESTGETYNSKISV